MVSLNNPCLQDTYFDLECRVCTVAGGGGGVTTAPTLGAESGWVEEGIVKGMKTAAAVTAARSTAIYIPHALPLPRAQKCPDMPLGVYNNQWARNFRIFCVVIYLCFMVPFIQKDDGIFKDIKGQVFILVLYYSMVAALRR